MSSIGLVEALKNLGADRQKILDSPQRHCCVIGLRSQSEQAVQPVPLPPMTADEYS